MDMTAFNYGYIVELTNMSLSCHMKLQTQSVNIEKLYWSLCENVGHKKYLKKKENVSAKIVQELVQKMETTELVQLDANENITEKKNVGLLAALKLSLNAPLVIKKNNSIKAMILYLKFPVYFHCILGR